MRWAAAVVLLLAGCGGGNDRIVVSAAASLTQPLTECSGDARLSFGGSDELAAQIRQGVRPDVYAAANTKLPDQLAQEGLVERPVTFATNELIVAVPDNGRVAALDDLAEPGVKLVIGAETVPVGSYTRDVLSRLPAAQKERILANVRSEEPDVKGVVGKLTQGAADAGFVYRTDLVEGLTAIALPRDLQPVVEYGAAVVTGAGEDARRYLDSLTNGACADALRAAGFGAP